MVEQMYLDWLSWFKSLGPTQFVTVVSGKKV